MVRFNYYEVVLLGSLGTMTQIVKTTNPNIVTKESMLIYFSDFMQKNDCVDLTQISAITKQELEQLKKKWGYFNIFNLDSKGYLKAPTDLKVKCLGTNGKTGANCQYIIQYENGVTENISTFELKSAMKLSTFNVTNMKLGSDGRLIHLKTDKPINGIDVTQIALTWCSQGAMVYESNKYAQDFLVSKNLRLLLEDKGDCYILRAVGKNNIQSKITQKAFKVYNAALNKYYTQKPIRLEQ